MHTTNHASREAVAEWLRMDAQSAPRGATQGVAIHLPWLVVDVSQKELRIIGSVLFGILVLLVINGLSWLLPARVAPIISYQIPRTMQWLPEQPVAVPVQVPLELQFRVMTLAESQQSLDSLVANLRHPAYNHRLMPLNPFVVEHKGQCTSYVWGRFYELTGKKIAPSVNRNAGFWAADARVAGYNVDMVPSPHSVAVWQKQGARRGVGHVAFVEGLAGDKVLLSEANWLQRGEAVKRRNGYALRYSAAQSMERRGFVFLGYIHLEEPAQAGRLVADAGEMQ